jgi:hypothetical protein
MSVNDPDDDPIHGLALHEAWRAQCAARPTFSISQARFEAYVRARLPAEPPAAPAPIDSLCLDDLFLACGCVRGDRRVRA